MTATTETYVQLEQPAAKLVAAAAPAPALKHSRYGLGSFALSLLVGGVEFLLIAAAAVLGAANPATMEATSPVATGLGLLMCAGGPLVVLGAALSVVGLLEKDRKKVFAVLGLVFNLSVVSLLGLLVLLGSLMQAAAS